MNSRTLALTIGAASVGTWLAIRALRSRYDLRGKVVLITGGSRGLGLILARHMVDEGAKLAICARDPEELDRAALCALMEAPGSESPIVNQAYSARCWPLKKALRGLPVRIKPGHTVVTTTPSRANSARRPSESPARANLLAP